VAITKPFHELLLFCNGILAITKSFTQTFFFLSRWNSGYHEAFHKFFFHVVETWLSRSLFTNFSFTWWNLVYHEAFSRIFLSHGGISAITKPFHEFFFHMMESRLSQSLFMNFSFTWWNLVYHEAFSQGEIHKMHNLGEDSFHIYHKEYLHRTRLIKNLASWFRAPFARKRVRSSYSKVIAKKKANVFFSEITYRFVIRPFDFLECKLAKKGKIL
jgi:hypothetical protein